MNVNHLPRRVQYKINKAKICHRNLLNSYKIKLVLSFQKIPLPVIEYIVDFLDESRVICKNIISEFNKNKKIYSFPMIWNVHQRP
jgi:hypothetical protein